MTDKPTRAQIEAELAGRRLDAWVQRFVFGSTDMRELPVADDPECGNPMVVDADWPLPGLRRDWCYLPKYEHDSTGDGFCEVVPAYSTDPAASAELERWLWASGRFESIESTTYKRWTLSKEPAVEVLLRNKDDDEKVWICEEPISSDPVAARCCALCKVALLSAI